MSPEELHDTIQEQKEDTAARHPQEIFSWKAPLRAYKRKSTGVLRFYLALTLLLTMLVFFFGDRILVLPIWAMLFLIYILTITPPPIVENRITKFGIETSSRMYRWESLSYFYFVKRFDYDMLVVVGQVSLGNHLYMVVPEEKMKRELTKIIGEHLIYMKEPQHNLTDKMAGWLTSLMPDEEEPRVDPSKPVVSTP